MKKSFFLFIIIFIINFNLFAESFIDSISKIDCIFLKVNEKTYVNNKKREKVYTIKVKLPDKMYKEIEMPTLNKGEVYIYNNNKKTVYMPKLSQVIEKELEDEENYIMMVINDLKEVSKLKKIKNTFEDKDKIFYFDNNIDKVVKIAYKDGVNIEFIEYKENFPKRINIYEDKSLISELDFLEVNTNVKYEDKEFTLKK